jgi:hypothetical protein
MWSGSWCNGVCHTSHVKGPGWHAWAAWDARSTNAGGNGNVDGDSFTAVSGLVLLSSGILGVWGGIRMMKFRGYKLGIIALSGGLLTIFGCYCAPTAIALFIYGLIVMLNPQVKQAFEMGEQGRSPADIQNHFARLPG